ncbi:MAG: Lrp/AsnC family transcriptional regulator [Aliishimia sp.]
MDKMDRELIALLRHDARAPLSELASRIGVSRSTVRARIERMQERGDIVGFGVILKADVVDAPVRGVMMIVIEGRGTERIVRQLTGMPDVRAVHSTNGRWDVILEISTQTLEQFDTTLHQIRRLDGVSSSETSLLLSTRKRA